MAEHTSETTTPRTVRDLKIGLALSGGGVRATVFHLGVLGRMAAEGLLEQVSFISTVSGGSIGTGLVYSIAGGWPTSDQFLSTVAPQAKKLLTSTSIQRDIVIRSFTRPWHLFRGRAKLTSESIQQRWGISGLVKDIPPYPRWIINATTYESGKNWRFMPQRMGDYSLNYVANPPIPVADAVAASSAFPGLIGYLALRTKDYSWFRYPMESRSETEPVEPATAVVHLWDGGVYDNLGVEALFKSRREDDEKASDEYRPGINFLIVSDASSGLQFQPFSLIVFRGMRLVSIAMDQVRGLRARSLVKHFKDNPNTGVFLRMGNTGVSILQAGGMATDKIEALSNRFLSETEVKESAGASTSLRRLTEATYELHYRHGWEVADCTLTAYCGSMFEYKRYSHKVQPHDPLLRQD